MLIALFVLTLAFSVGTLARAQDTVPYLLLTVAVVLAGASTVAFIYLIDYAARLLRPVSIVWRLGQEGIAVIEQVYPLKVKGPRPPSTLTAPPPPPARTILHKGTSAIILAVDLRTVQREAERTGGVIEFAHQVGNFLSVDEPLFHLYGGAEAADDKRLRSAVALGAERTLEQDATFAFRVIVDIAIKALSPAINDPTTAVTAIDQLQRLLEDVGGRYLRGETILDATGQPRLILRTPNWEDFVHVACTEIPSCGAGNVQIARRLRAMLDNLVTSLPPHRQPALDQQRQRLDRMIEGLYSLPEDLALARIPDSQGLGGSPGPRGPVTGS